MKKNKDNVGIGVEDSTKQVIVDSDAVHIMPTNPEDILTISGSAIIGVETSHKEIEASSKSVNQKEGMLKITGEGNIGFAELEKVSLTISEYNTLLLSSKWELLDVYTKNSCRTALWRNKKTNETQETIGLGLPGSLLVL